MSIARTQLRLGMAIAWYLALAIGVVTLVPFEFRWPAGFRLVGYATVADLVENIALFVPLGFFVAFARHGRPALAGFVLSLLVEFLQQFLPDRSPSLLDLATNTAGAWIGGLAHRAAARSSGERTRAAGVAALDLPLMGLVYLSVPLLWLSGLTGDDPSRRWLVALVGVMIAIVLASVGRQYLGPRGVRPAIPAVAGGMAMAVGLAPGWLGRPLIPLAAGVVVALLVAGFGAVLSWREPAGRRFELVTVSRAMLPLGCYLAATALWPFTDLEPQWRVTLALSEPVRSIGNLGILQLLELMAIATLAGYALAERRGRSEERAGRSPGLALGTAAAVGLVVAGVRGWHPGYGASVPEALLVGAAVWVGSVLYVRQRDFVRAVLGRPPVGPGRAADYRAGVADGSPTWR